MRPSGLVALIRPGRRHKVTSYWPAAEVCVVAVPPGPQQPNPGRQNPGALHPAGFPPGQLPPGQVLPWRARYGPPPARDALIFARIMLGIQAGLSSLSLLTAPLAFFDKPLPPGVTSQYGDLQAPSLTRNIIMLLVSVAVVAITVTTTFRLAPSRRRMWWLALATQAALAVLYGWLFTWLAIAPSAEGMASFAALIVGPVVVAIPVIGLVALLLPSARAAALGRHLGGPRTEL
jgi:hypothetical protein